MGLLSVPVPPIPDPRTVRNAYIRSGRNLYYVLGSVGLDRIALEDCRTLQMVSCGRRYVLDECQLVRAAAPSPRRL
jgi:hypothetical protein